jgi:BlaI family transcriptional regulator, penicillinase repressor
MADPHAHRLSRRERQIMDFLYRRGPATVAEVLDGLPDPPGYSAVRALLRTLEEKGVVRHHEDGPRYVYEPTVARESARRSALAHMVQTFFDGSTAQAMAALLDLNGRKLPREEVERLARLIEQSKKEGN